MVHSYELVPARAPARGRPAASMHGSTSHGTRCAQGGRRGASDELDSVECLQSGSDAWTGIAAMTLQRTSLTAAAMDGTVYAIGGQVRIAPLYF